MERESTKHGPRLDEEMELEVDGMTKGGLTGGRVEEFRDPEPAGDDQPQPTSMPYGVAHARVPTSEVPVTENTVTRD